MIQIVETYDCEEQGCGRKFETSEKLMAHYKNRHPRLHSKYSSEVTNDDRNEGAESRAVEEDQRKKILENLYEKITSLENVIKDNQMEGITDAMEMTPDVNDIVADTNTDSDEAKKAKASDIEQSGEVIATSDVVNDKILIITEEMIELDTRYQYYYEIQEINLENKSIRRFRNNSNIDFKLLSNLTYLNISQNFIKDISDLKFIPTLIHLSVHHNNIDDISVCEHLTNLEILNAEDNEIISINGLPHCRALRVLKLQNNKIKYLNSTLQVLKNLKELKELTIQNNPFLEEIFGSRHLLIYRHSNIVKLDNEELKEIDREIARRFIMENNPVSGAIRPNSSRVGHPKSLIGKSLTTTRENSQQEDIGKKTTSSGFTSIKVFDRVITKMDHITITEKTKDNPKEETEARDPRIEAKPGKKYSMAKLLQEVEKLKSENKTLQEHNKRQESEIQNLKLEIENIMKINKDYEAMINDYKNKLSSQEDHEKIKLRQQLELWKKEYCELLDRTMSTNTSGNFIEGNMNLNMNMITQNPVTVRPHTAKIQFNKPSEFESIVEEINIIKSKRKNSLEVSSEEEENAEVKIEDEDEDEEIDSDIDELCRKSMQNLEELKKEIKILNEQSSKKEMPPPVRVRSMSQSKMKIIKEDKASPVVFRKK